MKTLLLDFGSSFVKYSFYDHLERQNPKVNSVRFPPPVVDDGVRYEVKKEDIDRIAFKIFDEAAEQGCTHAVICVQMHGYFIRRKEQFSNYISWKDKRGDMYDDRISGVDFLRNGTRMKENLSVVGMCTFDLSEEAEFFTLGSYIAWLLTGNNVTHKTDGCASGFYDSDTLACNVVLSDKLSVPKVVDSISPVGSYRGIKLFSALGDHQTSFLGADVAEDELLLNIGTSAQLCGIVDSNSENSPKFEKRPYFMKGKCLLTLTGIDRSDVSRFWEQISDTVTSFGSRSTVVLAGGGAKDYYSVFKDGLESMGYRCFLSDSNVGNDGLRIIADSIIPVKGTMLSELPFVNFPILIGKSGLDFFIIDDEHGDFGTSVISEIALNSEAEGVNAIVRLPDNHRALITKLADNGVRAFLLPMTNTRQDIEQVVLYAKYAPVGKRGISTTRPHTRYGIDDLREYMENANQRMQIWAQIETVSGVENIYDILEAVTGVFIGPNDLSADIGCIGDTEALKPYIRKVCRACMKVGKPCGIITTTSELIEYALLNGASMVSYGSEMNMLKKSAKEIALRTYV